MATFLDELSRLNSQNFLGGVVQAGEAVREMRENKAVANLYNQFNIKRDELSTTSEQLSDFNKQLAKSPESIQDKPGGMLDAIGEATLNLDKVLQQTEAYETLYRPYITAFATLGQDGVNIANTLSRELESKKETLEKRGEIPLREMEFKRSLLDYQANSLKYRQMADGMRREQEYIDVNNLIVNSSNFENLAKFRGRQHFYNAKNFNKVLNELGNEKTAIMAEVSQRYQEMYGKEMPAEHFNAAFEKVINEYGFSPIKEEIDPTKLMKTAGMDSQLVADSTMAELKSLSNEWVNSPITTELRSLAADPQNLRADGTLDLSKVHTIMMEKYGNLWSTGKEDSPGYIEKFGGGGRYERAKDMIKTLRPNLFNQPGQPGLPGSIKKTQVMQPPADADDKALAEYRRVGHMPYNYDIIWFRDSGALLTGDNSKLDNHPDWYKDYMFKLDEKTGQLLAERRPSAMTEDEPLMDVFEEKRFNQLMTSPLPAPISFGKFGKE